MLNFHRNRDINCALYSSIQKENASFYKEPSNNIYDFILKNDSQIRKISQEICTIKSQIIDLEMKVSFNYHNSNNENNIKNISDNN